MLWTPNNLAIAGSYALAILIVYFAAIFRSMLSSGSGQVQPPSPFPGELEKSGFGKADLFIAGGLILFYVLSSIHPESEKPLLERLTSGGIIMSGAIQITIALGLIGFASRSVKISHWLGIPPRCDWMFFLLGPATIIGMWGLLVVFKLSGLMDFLSRIFRIDQTQDLVQVFNKSTDHLLLTLLGFTAVFVAPICEEIMFRGYLFRVMERYAGTMPAIIASSLVFACAHGNAVVMLPLFILALILCSTYAKSRSILPSISIHLLFNLATVTVQLIGRLLDVKIDKLP